MQFQDPDSKTSQEVLITPGQSMLPGKDGYRAPEIYRGQQHNGKSVDAFACGVVMYALAIGSQGTLKYPIERYLPRYLFSGDFSNLASHMESLGVQVSIGFTLFLEALLEPNPAQRTSVEKALTHPWMISAAAAKDLKSVGRASRQVANPKNETTTAMLGMQKDQLMGGMQNDQLMGG
jgi:serine/threonine protein kinase